MGMAKTAKIAKYGLKPHDLKYGRRILSCAFVRANESCLLDRLGHLDAGAREAAARRQATVREEERDRMEASAFFQAYVRGRGGARRGQLPS